MPELPEVETVCKGLATIFVGQRFTSVAVLKETLRFKIPANFAKRLNNKIVLSVERRAKFILIKLTDNSTLIIHLGMSGSFRVYSDFAPIEKHEHVIFHMSDNLEVRYYDPRRFGFMILTNTVGLLNLPMFKQLGPEPLASNLNGDLLVTILKGQKGPIKSALLNQKVIAGIGNIYASEVLHLAKISPKRRACNIIGVRSTRLAFAIISVLEKAIKLGGASLKDYRQLSGEMGYFQNYFRVYNQAGKYCKNCGQGIFIKRIVQSGRATFFCPKCQR